MGLKKEPKGTTNKKPNKKKILQDIKKKIESSEILSKPKYKWSEYYGITRPTFDSYVKEAVGTVTLPEVQEMTVEFRVIYEKLKHRLMVLWEREAMEGATRDELLVMKEYRATIADFTRLLEDYGFKQKAVDRIDLTGQVEHTLTIEQLQKIDAME